MRKGTVSNSSGELEIRLHPSLGDDTTNLREALQSIPVDQPCRLVFERGEYNFYEECCYEVFCFVSNNTSGLK